MQLNPMLGIMYGLYLGGIPIEEMGHREELLQKCKVSAILSIVEDWELSATTVVGNVINFQNLREYGVAHSTLSTTDYYPPSIQLLDEGANILNKHLSEGRSVYCHCKSGVGRSASVVVAYLIKYKRLNATEAWSEVKILRPKIFSDKSPQFKNIVAYEKQLREGRIK